jgi:AraC family transcriptional regulator of adaptative response / DNA-3-methyladenine glycosylase II
VHLDGLEALPSVIARVRNLFDLGTDPQGVENQLSRDPLLAGWVKERPGLRVPGAWDGFEIAVRAVLGQQISVRAATRLAGQLVQTLGEPLEHEFLQGGLSHAFPRPERFVPEKLATLGMPRARCATLANLAARYRADPGLFDAGRSLEEAVARLSELAGIGAWTAQYIAMRALRESDAFLAGDVALQRMLAERGVRPSAKALLARAEAWRPFRAYAVLHLWTADAAQSAAARSIPTRRIAREPDEENRDALAS